MSIIGQCWFIKLSWVEKYYVASSRATPNVHVMLRDPTIIFSYLKCKLQPICKSATTYATKQIYSSTNGPGTTLF